MDTCIGDQSLLCAFTGYCSSVLCKGPSLFLHAPRVVRSTVYSQIIAEVGASTCIKGGFLMQHIRFAANVLYINHLQDNLPLENKN